MKIKFLQFSAYFLLLFIAIICTALILFDYSRPECYKFLFFLPLCFVFISICLIALYKEFLNNFAITFIVILYFCRMVISPLFMYFGNYASTIFLNVNNNTNNSILLVCYEMLAVFLFLIFFSKNKKISIYVDNYSKKNSNKIISKKKYLFVIVLIILLIILCGIITPELFKIYRTIFDINGEFFRNQEDSYIIAKYGISFVKKLSLVLGNYAMRIAILLIPASLIIFMQKKAEKSLIASLLSYILCFIPIFFIGGAIARSLIYIVCLFLLKMYLNDNEINYDKKILKIGIVSFAIICIWWINMNPINSFKSKAESMSIKFSSYFSGVNIVSGTFNLPNNIEYKFKYFTYDFISNIPFGTTIFGIKDKTIQPFFNDYNRTYGQIPTTIGMGYYYFGYVLAPIYSIIFSFIAYICAEVIKKRKVSNAFQYVRLIYTVFVFCMGVIMYNIEITMINLFCVIIPIYLIEKVSCEVIKKYD